MSRAAPGAAGPDSAGDSAFQSSLFDRPPEAAAGRALAGPRLQVLLLLGLAALSALLLLARHLATAPDIGAGPGTQWSARADGGLWLQASSDPALVPHVGQRLVAIEGPGSAPVAVDGRLLQRSARWQADDAGRPARQQQRATLAALLDSGSPLSLHFADGRRQAATPAPRGWAGLGAGFWPLSVLGLLLLLQGGAVLAQSPGGRSPWYALMCAAQAGSLLYCATLQVHGLVGPAAAIAVELPLRAALDLVTAAAGLHALAAGRRPFSAALLGLGWSAALLTWVLVQQDAAVAPWWLLQGVLTALGAAAVWAVGRALRLEPDPFVALQRRLVATGLALGAVVTAITAAALHWPQAEAALTAAAALSWHLGLAGLLLLLPHLVRSPQLLRELALLAGSGALLLALQLGLAALLPLPAPAALVLALAVAGVAYVALRPWLMPRLRAAGAISTERTFEQLYRAARELQARPARLPRLLSRLLREMFNPLELQALDSAPARATVRGGGAELLVPLRDAASGEDLLPPEAPSALRLRFAQQGRRLFTPDDARLAERVVDQLRRAVAYDRAVERGRSEERLRIAQDLHDDIGARLLTLMYQAPQPEMEDYIRHTLQDLKTLTRGLAASEHRLSHAVAEWKADLTQRLSVAQLSLGWTYSADRDLVLTVVQWSALTRVLRELASNALAHAQATRIDVQLQLAGPALLLTVSDDGCGRAPQDWSHGLGLGGVRKRVKQLGGSVEWRELQPRGIVCEVRVAQFASRD